MDPHLSFPPPVKYVNGWLLSVTKPEKDPSYYLINARPEIYTLYSNKEQGAPPILPPSVHD